MKTRYLLETTLVTDANALVKKLKRATVEEIITCRLLMYFTYCTSPKPKHAGSKEYERAETEERIADVRVG
jgi:hypothetical protein